MAESKKAAEKKPLTFAEARRLLHGKVRDMQREVQVYDEMVACLDQALEVEKYLAEQDAKKAEAEQYLWDMKDEVAVCVRQIDELRATAADEAVKVYALQQERANLAQEIEIERSQRLAELEKEVQRQAQQAIGAMQAQCTNLAVAIDARRKELEQLDAGVQARENTLKLMAEQIQVALGGKQ